MKRVFVILMAIGLSACAPNQNTNIDDTEEIGRAHV